MASEQGAAPMNGADTQPDEEAPRKQEEEGAPAAANSPPHEAAAEPKQAAAAAAKEDGAPPPPPPVSTAPLQVRDRCRVRWRGGEQNLLASVVARRRHRERPDSDAKGGGGSSKRTKRQHSSSSTEIGDLDGLPPDRVDYYVHYVDHDRRLDEWVTHDKFLLDTLERHNQRPQQQPEPDAGGVASAAASGGSGVEDDGGGGGDEEGADDDDDEEDDSGDAATGETNDSNAPTGRLLTRRRSSASASNHPSERQGANDNDNNNNNNEQQQQDTSFSFSGGNWHGGSSSGDPAASAFEREHEETTKIKNIQKIVMGGWEVEAWYYSPFPAEYSDIETLYVCEFCLQYMKKRRTLRYHRARCPHRRPPGREIYREGDLSVFELDGRDHRAYCQKLCLLAKLFLDHKTLYYDVNPFFFYVVTTVDSDGAHIVGYFSKEKVSTEGYNLACILTFPQYQKSGYGKFIISLSYELTKREGITGSPEKPLSDLGKVSYRSYWTHVLMNLLAQHDSKSNLSINDISTMTGIKTEDLISTLQSLDMIKVWKGQHVIYVKQETIANYMKQDKKLRLCKSEFLTWGPPTGSSAAKENA